MNRNRKKAAAATLAAGMAVVLGAGTVMAAASTGDNGLQKEETVYVNTTAGVLMERIFIIRERQRKISRFP